jgi:serine/threonine-protein kinase
MTSSTTLGPGDVLLGKYELRRMIGRGGVGVVFEAEHVRLRQRVAVKFLAAEMLANPAMIERFEREARAMALITSPYVTRVTDVDVTPRACPSS